ncbi:MAG: RAMP superfamily CRISPR-associated protein [Acidimicrobiales bacterium]
MRFDITFHTPFRISTGAAGRGVDAAIDLDDPLPGSSLKGVMVASAVGLLGRSPLVDEIFGTSRRASPWSWSAADVPAEARAVLVRAAVQLDHATGTATKGGLRFGEVVDTPVATFDVDPLVRLDGDVRHRHETVLLLAAHATHALGSSRRRGLGWVGIAGSDPLLDDDRLGEVHELLGSEP